MTLILEYPGHDTTRDRTIQSLVVDSGGDFTGSGYDLFCGTRDLAFTFDEETVARGAAEVALSVFPDLTVTFWDD